jgi:hypothetical protein
MVEDLDLTRKDIHEACMIRDAEGPTLEHPDRTCANCEEILARRLWFLRQSQRGA